MPAKTIAKMRAMADGGMECSLELRLVTNKLRLTSSFPDSFFFLHFLFDNYI